MSNKKEKVATQVRIKTWQEAFEKEGLDPANMPDLSMVPEEFREAMLSHYKLMVCAKVLNDGWEPNWNDLDEYKYFPWFDVDADDQRPSGFGLSYGDYVGWSSASGVGSRLCYKNADLAKYAGTTFKDLYEGLFLKR